MGLNFDPNKPIDPAHHKAVLRTVVDAAQGPKAVAERIGRRKSQLYAYCDPQSEQEISLASVVKIAQAHPDACRTLVDYLCQLVGGYFVPLQASEASVAVAMAASIKEHAELSATVCQALEDGHVSAVDGLEALREAREARAAVARMEAAILAAIEKAAAPRNA